MLLEASRKDFLEGLAVIFGEEDFSSEGEVNDFACMPDNLRTSGEISSSRRCVDTLCSMTLSRLGYLDRF